MDVDHPRRIVQPRRQVTVADVHPPHEGHPAVDREDLAVAAQVQVPGGREELGRNEERQGHPAPAQELAGPGPGVDLAVAVEEHAHVDAALRRRRQGVDDFPPALVGVEDVAREHHRALGLFDRREHRGVGLLAVVEHLHRVARHQHVARHGVGDPHQRAEPPRHQVPDPFVMAFRRLHRALEGRLLVLVVELARPGPDAVDAEKEVRQRPDGGKSEAEGDPGHRRPRLALVDQGVPGGEHPGDDDRGDEDPLVMLQSRGSSTPSTCGTLRCSPNQPSTRAMASSRWARSRRPCGSRG